MSVHYKFKSNLDYDTVTFDGLHISVADLKKSIMQQKKIGKSSDFDLQITNAQTKEVYDDDESLIPKNTSVIVARVPVVSSNKKSWERSDLPLPADDDELSGQINFDKVVKSADLVNANASEEDKVKAMISQSSQEYDPSKYVKSRSMTGPLPPTYTCFRCGKQGHWIKNCPTNNIDIKRSTGIPRSFMVPVDGPEHKGALLTSSGEYAVPLIDHVAYKEVKKEKPPFVNMPEQEAEPEAQIPEELLCMVCRDLLQDAVLIPCCGNSFCDECVRQVLLDSDNHECPQCHETGISPDTVIPNRFLRTAVLNFRNETGYTRMRRMPQIPFPQPSHIDSPQPSPDSTVENQAPSADPDPEPDPDPVVEDVPVEDTIKVQAPEDVESEAIQLPECSTEPEPQVEEETEEHIEPGTEDLQPGTPLADEPPVHNEPETEINEPDQYSSHSQYDEENKFSYSHYYNENMDFDTRDESHVSSTEVNQISTINTITTRPCYKPRLERPFIQQRPIHHGHTRDPEPTLLPPRHGSSSHSYRSKPQDWTKGSLTVLVERDYNRDRSDYRDRYDRRNRDNRPTTRFPQRSQNRYERLPRDSRYNQADYHSENHHGYHRDFGNNSELREDVNYEIRTSSVNESVHSHPPRYNVSPSSEHSQSNLSIVPPPPTQVLPRPHGIPPLTVAQPFPPQPPPPGSSPIDNSTQPPPPGVGPLPPLPSTLSDPSATYKPTGFEPSDKKPEPKAKEEMSIDDRMDKFARELQRSRSRDRQPRSRSRSRSRDWSRSSSRSPAYRSSKSWSRSISRSPSRSSRSHSHSSYFSRSRSHSRSYSPSRSRSRSKSRSYTRSRSVSRSRTRSRSRSRIRHRRDSRERIRSPIVSARSNSVSPKINRPRNRRSPFQVKRSYTSPYKPSYPIPYGGPPPPPVSAPPPPAVPHVMRPHTAHQIHTIQPISHAPPANHYNNVCEYQPERPMFSHGYDDQYHGYNSYQRQYIPPRYEPRNSRFSKPPQEHPKHGDDVPSRIPGWIGDRRRNCKMGYQQQRESREQQRRETSKVVRIIHQAVKMPKVPYVTEIREEPPVKKTDDKALNKHKKHHIHHHRHRNKEVRKQDGEEFHPSESRSETPVNLIKVEVLPDTLVVDSEPHKSEGQNQEKLKKHKRKKHKTVEQTEKKKKPSKKEKGSSVQSSEPENTGKVKAKRKKNKGKEDNQVVKKKSKSKHVKIATATNNEEDRGQLLQSVSTPEQNNQKDPDVENEEIKCDKSYVSYEEAKTEDGPTEIFPEIASVKQELNENSESKSDVEKDKECELQEDSEEPVSNLVESGSPDKSLEEATAEEIEDNTLHVEPPAISKWEREEYDDEVAKPQHRMATVIHKEEKESLSSDIIQRAEKAILQKPLKTAIVATLPPKDKHSSKTDRKVAKNDSSPDDRLPFAAEYAELKMAAGVDCGADESPTLQVTISTDKDKRSVHAKKKFESRSSVKEENSNLKRLKLDRSKFMDKSGDSSTSHSNQRTIVVSDANPKNSSKRSDWQRNFDEEEAKDSKYEKTKIIVTKRNNDHRHQTFKGRGGDHSVQKYSDQDFSYAKRRKYENSDRERKVVPDETRFRGAHSSEDPGHGRKYVDREETTVSSKVHSLGKEKKDAGFKHVGSNQTRSRSYDSTGSFSNGQTLNPKKHHRSKCTAQILKHHVEENNSQRFSNNELLRASRENKMHDKKPNRRRSSRDDESDIRPPKHRDISHDESRFEPNYDGTSESDHSGRVGRSDGKDRHHGKISKRSGSGITESDPKRVKQDKPLPSASVNVSNSHNTKVRIVHQSTVKHTIQSAVKDPVSSSESSSYQSESDSSASDSGKKISKNKGPEAEHKHKHKKSKHKKHKKHKHKHKKKKSHKSKQKD